MSPFSHFFAPFYFNDFEGLESLKGHDQEEALNARLKEVGKLFEELNQVDWDAAAEALMTDLQRALGDTHPDVFRIRKRCAEWATATSRDSAHEAFITYLKRTFGDDHPLVLDERIRHAGCLNAWEGVAAYESLIPDLLRAFTADHPDLLDTRQKSYWSDPPEPEEILKDYRNVLARALYDAAYCFRNAGRIADAVAAFEAPVIGMQRALGDNHPDVLAERVESAGQLLKWRFNESAINAFEALIPDLQIALGDSHPDTLNARCQCAMALRQAERLDEAKVAFETLIAESQLVLDSLSSNPRGRAYSAVEDVRDRARVWLNELTTCDEDLDLDSFLEEGTPSDAGGTEVHEGWRTGCSVTLYEIEGRYFVEWNADEGSTFGWEEVYCGSSQEDFDAVVAEYLDLYSGSVAPSEEHFGLANDTGPDSFEISQATLVGSVDFYNLVIDDRQSGVEIWQADDGPLVVTRQLDGKVLGSFSDLAAIRSKIRFSDTTYRKLFLPAGSKQGQEEAW